MGYTFVRADSEGLTGATPTTARPRTVMGWSKPGADAFGGSRAIADISDASAFDHHATTELFQGFSRVGERAGGASRATVSTVTVEGVWSLTVCTFVSSTERNAFQDGSTITAQSTGNITPANLDVISVGYLDRNTDADHYDGDIGHVAVWTSELTATQIDQLAAGVSPRMIDPANRVYYLPLSTDLLVDEDGAVTMSATGTPVHTTAEPPVHFTTRMMMGVG